MFENARQYAQDTSNFPELASAFSRDDVPVNRIVPSVVAFFMLPTRLMFFGIFIMICAVIVSLPNILISQKNQRQYVLFTAWLIQTLALNTWVTVTEGEHSDSRRAIISNHASPMDVFVLISTAGASFVANDGVRGIPGIGHIGSRLGCTFVYRGKNAEKRERCKNAILDKIVALSEGTDKDGYVVFPEGTVTNGNGMIQFKSGVFQPAYENDKVFKEVQPAIIRYFPALGAPKQTLATQEQAEWLAMTVSTLWTKATLKWLPPIKAPVCPPDMDATDCANVYATHAWEKMSEAAGMPMMSGTLTALKKSKNATKV